MSNSLITTEMIVMAILKTLNIVVSRCLLVSVMLVCATNTLGQPASALQRNSVEKASPFGNVEPATGAASVWHPVQSPSPVAPKANSAVQAVPLMSRVKSSFTISTPTLVMTGVQLNIATPQLAFTGLQMQVMTDRLILIGKK